MIIWLKNLKTWDGIKVKPFIKPLINLNLQRDLWKNLSDFHSKMFIKSVVSELCQSVESKPVFLNQVCSLNSPHLNSLLKLNLSKCITNLLIKLFQVIMLDSMLETLLLNNSKEVMSLQTKKINQQKNVPHLMLKLSFLVTQVKSITVILQSLIAIPLISLVNSISSNKKLIEDPVKFSKLTQNSSKLTIVLSSP